MDDDEWMVMMDDGDNGLLQTAFALKPNPALLVFNWLSIPNLRFFFSLFYPLNSSNRNAKEEIDILKYFDKYGL